MPETFAPTVFRYVGWEWEHGELRCTYALDEQTFTERVQFEDAPDELTPALAAAARLVFLVSGVSYYKAGAPPTIELGEEGATPTELTFLRAFYREGLGEFGYVNDRLGLLESIEFRAASRGPEPAAVSSDGMRPLVPFGGGIDSIVVVEEVLRRTKDVELFVSSRFGARFEAIEDAAAVTGLRIRRANREIAPEILESRARGYLNGHVPVTGVLSALAVFAALVAGRNQVIMSNEWSASSPTLEVDGRSINHQWSKSIAFEQLFRSLLFEALPGFDYHSALRSRSELWVAKQFATLTQYHHVFRSCNEAFYLDPAKRLDHWCGKCDKCCFVDLILAPYLSRAQLDAVFDGAEPMRNDGREKTFRSLLGDPAYVKPFECVGDIGESRTALHLASGRPDRLGEPLLQRLAAEFAAESRPHESTLLEPVGPTFAPEP